MMPLDSKGAPYEERADDAPDDSRDHSAGDK
jgi:hypothetical protein